MNMGLFYQSDGSEKEIEIICLICIQVLRDYKFSLQCSFRKHNGNSFPNCSAFQTCNDDDAMSCVAVIILVRETIMLATTAYHSGEV